MRRGSRNHTAENRHRGWRHRAMGIAVGVAAGCVAAAAVAAGTPAIIKMSQPADPDMGPALFRHWKHQRVYKCFACHPSIFSQTDSAVFDHDVMEAGKYCGTCHDGKVAFPVHDEPCESCHAD